MSNLTGSREGIRKVVIPVCRRERKNGRFRFDSQGRPEEAECGRGDLQVALCGLDHLQFNFCRGGEGSLEESV
jgi:hypothetical protein